MIDIGEIKILRKKLDITQTQLAEKAGVSQAYIAKVEGKKIDPKISTFNKILRALEHFRKDIKRAEDLMNSPIISVNPEDKLIHAMDLMRENNISQLPVIQGDTVVGSLTEKSVLKKLNIYKIEEFAEKKVKTIMQEPFPVVPKNEVMDAVLPLLREDNAVLVKSKSSFAGIITRADVLNLGYPK
ncbi:MAG: CBS domain-containing protein [Euryarchaeota archaeon]|nr:CBS domain-containing protein [Euryarchaeota archaeon]